MPHNPLIPLVSSPTLQRYCAESTTLPLVRVPFAQAIHINAEHTSTAATAHTQPPAPSTNVRQQRSHKRQQTTRPRGRVSACGGISACILGCKDICHLVSVLLSVLDRLSEEKHIVS